MNKVPIVLFTLLAVQCGKPIESVSSPQNLAAPEAPSESWVGEYLSGDDGYVGVSLELKENGEFRAWDFSCMADGTMKGTWSAEGDWVEFALTEAMVERGEIEDFPSLPRMKRVKYMNEVVLLPNGNHRLLEQEEFRIIEVYTQGGRETRDRFLEAWFTENPLIR